MKVFYLRYSIVMALETRDRQSQASAAGMASLSFEHVSVRLGERQAVQDISFAVRPGSFVGLVGPNGSGKSTLIRAILGIVPLSEGRILANGREPAQARELFSYLPQRQQVELELPLRAWDVVVMGRLRKGNWLRGPNKRDREVAAWALRRVEMLDRCNSSISELSFGQQQRVFLARALAQEGRIMLLDEPMTGVDSRTQELFEALLAELQAEGRTILMATHDLNQAACICDQVCLLKNSLIAYGPPEEVLTPEQLHLAYGSHIHVLDAGAGAHAEILEDVHHHVTDDVHGRPHA